MSNIIGGGQLLKQQPPQLVVASPINDAQLIAMIALKAPGGHDDPIGWAIEFLAKTIVRLSKGELRSKVDELARK